MERLAFMFFMYCAVFATGVAAQPVGDTIAQAETTAGIHRDSTNRDTLLLPDLSGLEPIFENVLIYDFFTTVNAIHYENSRTQDQQNELNFYYNIVVNNFFKTRFFVFRSYFFNEYGVKHYFDSVTIKGQDNFQTRNVLQVNLKKRYLKLQAGITSKSQFWKTYNRQADSSSSERKYLYTDYFSPGYIVYSCGLNYTFWKNATIDIGVVGGRITKIRNQAIFDERRSKKLYGLERGESKKESYGFNLVFNVPPRRISKHFGWESTGSLYADKEQIGRLQGYSFEAMNVLHYMFLKNLRVSLRSQVKYDEQISPKIFVMNMISIGFYLSNKI